VSSKVTGLFAFYLTSILTTLGNYFSYFSKNIFFFPNCFTPSSIFTPSVLPYFLPPVTFATFRIWGTLKPGVKLMTRILVVHQRVTIPTLTDPPRNQFQKSQLKLLPRPGTLILTTSVKRLTREHVESSN